MGLLKKITKIGKNIINDPWQTIGTVAGAAVGGPLGAALGNIAGGVASQGPGNYVDHIGPNLLSAGISAAGTYGAGFLGDALSGTSLGNGINSLSNDAGFGDIFSPAADAARTAVSETATSAAPSSSFLSGYLPAGGAGGTGGGSSGGFLDSLFGSGGGDIAAGSGMQVGKLYSGEGLPWLNEVGTGALAPNAYVDYPGMGGLSGFLKNPVDSITSGAKDMVSPKKLAGGALKLAIPSLLNHDNASGYNVVGDAGRAAAGNYQPFLDGGQQATKTLADLYGLNGADAASAATTGFEDTPGYQFARDQGIKALDASAARNGMLRSGNQEQAVQQYGTGLAQQYYQQFLQNLQQQQATGLNAAGGVSTGNMTAADAYAQLKQNKANNSNRLIGGLSAFL